MAEAFERAWDSLAPGIGPDPAEIQNARLWLAEVLVERAKYHTTVESLERAAIYAVVREALNMR